MRDKELELELVTKLPRIICIKKNCAKFPLPSQLWRRDEGGAVV